MRHLRRYLAERAFEELNKLKETPVAAAAKGTEKKDEEKKDGEKETGKPKDATDSAKTAAKALPDTFRYHLSYADSIFSLCITKENDLTVLEELCKDPKTSDTDCKKERIVEADEKTVNGRVAAMIQKLSGAEFVDPAGIKPANVYTKYKKEEAAKQVKEKSAELKKY